MTRATALPPARWPGVALAAGVGGVAWGAAELETAWLGQPVVEALVVAILLGTLVRAAWPLPSSTGPGIRFAAGPLLEVAVFLLGATVDVRLLVQAGPLLVGGIVLVVAGGLALGGWLGRLAGLDGPLATLLACGNAICGNSAIAAVAPVIDADPRDVASAVAFTAILGVAVVVGLPLLQRPLGLSDYEYGVLAGLTVYAVPQVLAAAFPVSAVSGEVGTLVKLVRVLMLGPVVLFFALRHRARGGAGVDRSTGRLPLARLVPWFIAGFVALAAARAVGLVPASVGPPSRLASQLLTVVAMAALGLQVDLRALRAVGPRVVAVVAGSLVLLGVLSGGLLVALRQVG